MGMGLKNFLISSNTPTTPNLMINVVLHLLVSRLRSLSSLPKRLYIQMDNCGRENKNQYVLAFLSLIVEKDVFEEASELPSLLLST